VVWLLLSSVAAGKPQRRVCEDHGIAESKEISVVITVSGLSAAEER